jgi:microcystin-dependent protein
MGQMGGAENITLMNQNMPMHTHLANCNSGPGTSTAPNGNVWAECGKPPAASAAYAPAANAQMAPTAIGMAGGNVPVAILPPYLCVNFIIATVGIFPTRD